MEQLKKTCQKMINFDDVTKKHKTANSKLTRNFWPLIVEGSVSGKTNALLKLINHERDIDTIYLCAKDPLEEKYQFFINKLESTGSKYLNDSKILLNTRKHGWYLQKHW